MYQYYKVDIQNIIRFTFSLKSKVINKCIFYFYKVAILQYFFISYCLKELLGYIDGHGSETLSDQVLNN